MWNFMGKFSNFKKHWKQMTGCTDLKSWYLIWTNFKQTPAHTPISPQIQSSPHHTKKGKGHHVRPPRHVKTADHIISKHAKPGAALHTEKIVICLPMYTGVHRHPWLARVTKRWERIGHPISPWEQKPVVFSRLPALTIRRKRPCLTT